MSILMILALVCLAIAALAPIFGWGTGRFNALAWGLLFWAAAESGALR